MRKGLSKVKGRRLNNIVLIYYLQANNSCQPVDGLGQVARCDLREARRGKDVWREVRHAEHEARHCDGDEGIAEPERDGGVQRVGSREVLKPAGGGGDDDNRGLYDRFYVAR